MLSQALVSLQADALAALSAAVPSELVDTLLVPNHPNLLACFVQDFFDHD